MTPVVCENLVGVGQLLWVVCTVIAHIINAGHEKISDLRIGMYVVPSAIDSVTVSSADRSRQSRRASDRFTVHDNTSSARNAFHFLPPYCAPLILTYFFVVCLRFFCFFVFLFTFCLFVCLSEQNPARTKEAELALMSRLLDAKKEVKRCLCDDFDTPGAVGGLQELVKAVNKVGAGALLRGVCVC